MPGRSAGVREEGKTGSRDLSAGDPVGLRDKVSPSCFYVFLDGVPHGWSTDTCMYFL